MNKKYFLALASVAVSVAIYSCGSGDVVDFYNDDIDGVPGQAMLDEMTFTNTLQDESVVNNYKDKYGNGSVPPPESSSSVDPIPTDSTPTGGGEIPLSSSVPEFPLSSSSIGIILPPVSSGEDGSSSSAPDEVPLSSSSTPTPELSSSSSVGVIPQSSSANTPTPVSSSSANSGESLEPVTCPDGEECLEYSLKYAGPKQTFEAPGVYKLKLEDAGRGQLVCGPGSNSSEPQTIMKITNAEETQILVIPGHNSESSLGSVTDSLVYVQVYDGFSGSFCEHKW